MKQKRYSSGQEWPRAIWKLWTQCCRYFFWRNSLVQSLGKWGSETQASQKKNRSCKGPGVKTKLDCSGEGKSRGAEAESAKGRWRELRDVHGLTQTSFGFTVCGGNSWLCSEHVTKFHSIVCCEMAENLLMEGDPICFWAWTIRSSPPHPSLCCYSFPLLGIEVSMKILQLPLSPQCPWPHRRESGQKWVLPPSSSIPFYWTITYLVLGTMA